MSGNAPQDEAEPAALRGETPGAAPELTHRALAWLGSGPTRSPEPLEVGAARRDNSRGSLAAAAGFPRSPLDWLKNTLTARRRLCRAGHRLKLIRSAGVKRHCGDQGDVGGAGRGDGESD